MNTYEHEIIHDDSTLQLHFRPLRSENGYSPLHWHSHLEIVFILSGYMIAFVNDKKYTLKKDDMLVVNPRELHSTRTFGEVDYILLQIPYDYLSRSLEQVSLLQFQVFFPSITMNSTQKKLRDCLFTLLETYEKKKTDTVFTFLLWCMNFYIFCTKITPGKFPGKAVKKKTETLNASKKPSDM